MVIYDGLSDSSMPNVWPTMPTSQVTLVRYNDIITSMSCREGTQRTLAASNRIHIRERKEGTNGKQTDRRRFTLIAVDARPLQRNIKAVACQ